MQDPVSDMLTCIRNAQMMGIQEISLPGSQLKGEILRVLQEEGYIDSFQLSDAGNNKKVLSVVLKYFQGLPVIAKIKRVSRPALRVYQGFKEIAQVRGGLGIAIISTPKGVMTDKSARAQKVGGEVLCTVE
jgi:small subunit ribosomal protein S8